MTPADGDRDPQRILIVDDEPAVREALQRSLAFEGYDTEVAVDGADALDKASTYKPDLVVLDIQMPRMDGLTAARRIRGAGDTTPILMLTARDTIGDRVTGLDAGADDYLVKPFAFAELVARVRALARRTAPTPPEPLCRAGVRLDPASRTVTRDGVEVTLTRREFALLEELLRAQGAVVRTRDLLDRAWDKHYTAGTGALRVTVATLRRKLGDPPLIETVPGVGYRL